MTPKRTQLPVIVRQTTPADFDAIERLCKRIYPLTEPYDADVLRMHLELFPEGQMVAVLPETGEVVGMTASLIVNWDDYDFDAGWMSFTDGGFFTNHDSEGGRTLYGAEVMVDPDCRGYGVGKALYKARRDLVRRLGLLRIRAGARLRNYGKYADQMSAQQYVRKVIDGEIGDPTLSFQLKQGFSVVAVVQAYIPDDPESHGYAAVIEWINHEVAARRDYRQRNPTFSKRRRRTEGST